MSYIFYEKSSPKKCLLNCPSTSPFYVDTYPTKECLTECPNSAPFYKYGEYKCQSTSICLDNPDKKYFVEGHCATLNECTLTPYNKNFVDSRNICIKKCKENEFKYKIENNAYNAYECKSYCEIDKFIVQPDSNDIPECAKDCPQDLNFIGKNNICKKNCEQDDGTFYYLFAQKPIPNSASGSKYNIYKCIDECKDIHDNHILKTKNPNDKQCYKNCPNEYPYLSLEEKLCYDICLSSQVNSFTLKEEKFCDKNCNSNYPYYSLENKICINSCNQLGDKKIADYDNKCVEKCNFDSSYPCELNGKCVDSCDKRYSKNDLKCKEKCGDNEFLINEKECDTQCNKFIFIEEGEKKCVESCPESHKYYYPDKKICLENCYNSDKAIINTNMDNNKCVNDCNEISTENEQYFLYRSETFNPQLYFCKTECPSEANYIDKGECVKYCPDIRKFYIVSETNLNYCLPDCPEDYPYYIIEKDSLYITRYKCQKDCRYFAKNDDPPIKTKLCLDSCPDNNNPHLFKYKHGNQCFQNCPEEFKYHFLNENFDNTCYKECPSEENAPYHVKGEELCRRLDEFDGGFLLYDIKEWTSTYYKCPDDYNLTSNIKLNINSNAITICLKQCNFVYNNNKYEFLTYDNKCVKDCSSIEVDIGENFENDVPNKKCKCPNKFYIDSNSKMICIPQCKDNTFNLKLLHGTNQCLQKCTDDRILNPSEDECYEKNTPCSEMGEEYISKTELIITKDGQKKCECKYKFYYEGDKKICLGENGVCQSGNNLLILHTNECVSSCPNDPEKGKYNFQNLCLIRCPDGSYPDEDNKCIGCENKFWHQPSKDSFQCLDGSCLEQYPVYIYKIKQCVKTCKGTLSNYLFNKACYDSSDFIPNAKPINIDSPLAKFQCICERPWYYEFDTNNNKIMHCPPENSDIKLCKDYKNDNIDLPFMIDETNECVKECPEEYPYYFNNICYTSCEYANSKNPLNIETVENSFECKCQNLWYIDINKNNDIICYDKNENECPPNDNIKSTSYLIFRTKQCVNDINECPESTFKFNHICYDRCPEFTIEKNSQDKICICNICNNCNAQIKKDYLWLEYEKYGNIYYQCGLNSCPEESIEEKYTRKNFLENENKCVLSCSEDKSGIYLYSFRNRCVEKCPNLTETKNDTCEFYDLSRDNIDNLDTFKEAANIQAKELYDKSDHLSGFLMNKFDASLQIYSTDRFNTYKELSMKSNLTYIDLGTCREKIYADYHLEDNDKILIAKYDLLNRMNKNEESDNIEISKDNRFLINQVEYEFYLERTMEKIEGSICSPYEIVISYPISFNKNKFNNFENGINDNNYLKLFKIGKELNKKNPEIDIFNKDNKVYNDICSGVELDGKDLVLEDRYDNLYPNNISLCESNCTMNNTDYILERINCLCTYKEVFDFYRTDEDNNDILNDPNFIKPTQSKSNIEIIKCLSKLNLKEDLLKNEAFYASSAITVVEIISVIASALKGIKTISSFAKGLINMKGALGNPPKKGENNYENNDNDLIEIRKKNVINKKNIIINNTPGTINSKNSVSEITSNNKLYNINSIYHKKADFIPPKYNFKFFRTNDKGVVKRIRRSQIPFKISPDTKFLLEAKNGVIYDKNYLKGPFYEDQNIIEIMEDKNIKYIDEDLSDRSNIVINKNYYKNNGIFKEEFYKSNKGEKDFIKITKKNPINNLDMSITLYKKGKDKENKLYNIASVYTLIKREHTYLRVDYKLYITKSHPNILATILAEILDKIYFIKIFIFLKKFEITSIHLSLYLFYHILLLSLLCGFFTINTIKRIWNEDNFPNIKFYLLYGLITHIIVWIIYKIFIVLLDNQDQFMKLSLLNNNKNKSLRVNTNKNNNEIDIETYNDQLQKNIEEKSEEIIKKIKIQTIIFYIVIILFTEFCSAYLISFFAIYTGTKKYILKTYYISIIEIIIIKFVYGLSLGSLRIAAEVNEFVSLYNFVYICDKYIS